MTVMLNASAAATAMACCLGSSLQQMAVQLIHGGMKQYWQQALESRAALKI